MNHGQTVHPHTIQQWRHDHPEEQPLCQSNPRKRQNRYKKHVDAYWCSVYCKRFTIFGLHLSIWFWPMAISTPYELNTLDLWPGAASQLIPPWGLRGIAARDGTHSQSHRIQGIRTCLPSSKHLRSFEPRSKWLNTTLVLQEFFLSEICTKPCKAIGPPQKR